ncbi:PLC-like phosphodiesterase [Trichoderma camerunense]
MPCFRWQLIFFVLGLASLASGLPIPGNKALNSSHPPTGIFEEQEDGTHNISVGDNIKKRQWKDLPTPHITLINATPYKWQRGYIHQYQMPDWEEDFPEHIDPGDMAPVLIQPSKYHHNWADSAAEVVYDIVGTSEPMSFMVKFNNRHNTLTVEFLHSLSSMNNAKGSIHEFDITTFPGTASGFIIAGQEGHFITNDPPIDWMQTMLPELKDKPLREIVLGRSHHSGLWRSHRSIGLASSPNTVTQSVNLHEQLGNGGIRVLDFRPLKIGDEFCEVHGVRTPDPLGGIMFQGSEGALLSDMIQTVNEFNRKYPGELIIWDVHSHDAWNQDEKYRELSDNQTDRVALYNQFLAVENRVNIPDAIQDLSPMPLGWFIGNKTSAVLINFDDAWREKDIDVFPGKREGFITGRILPLNHPWSDTNNVHDLAKDQIAEFHAKRPVPQSPIIITEWVLTMKGTQFIKDTILKLASPAWRSLFVDLWPAATSESYPNWISMDNVRGNQQKTLVMAMNHCLVAKKCGVLGGKVNI